MGNEPPSEYRSPWYLRSDFGWAVYYHGTNLVGWLLAPLLDPILTFHRRLRGWTP